MVADLAAVRRAFKTLLESNAVAAAHFEELTDNQVELVIKWLAGAATPDLRQSRMTALERRMRYKGFHPYLELADFAWAELEGLYGDPQLFNSLPPQEQRTTLEEQRVLGVNRERNYDDSRIWFRSSSPEDKFPDLLRMVYPRPCVITGELTFWLDCNAWETIADVERCFRPK